MIRSKAAAADINVTINFYLKLVTVKAVKNTARFDILLCNETTDD